MVKIFSVEWMAQSSRHDTKEAPLDAVSQNSKPHIPCMVQPRPPTSYDKNYLQAKARSTAIGCSGSLEKSIGALSLDSALHPDASMSQLQAGCSRPMENSGYSSGYDSEVALSDCASIEDSMEEREGIPRRVRTKFTPQQIRKMEKIFDKQKYLDAEERVQTAHKLNLTETQVCRPRCSS